MNEIYWLTRLDALNTILIISFIVGCIVVFATTILILGMRSDDGHEDDDDNYVLAKKVLKSSSIASFIICLLFILTPTQKQALIIWGVGGTIDYIKSNDTAKQLPDKCIKALDKFVDEYMLNEEDNKEK